MLLQTRSRSARVLLSALVIAACARAPEPPPAATPGAGMAGGPAAPTAQESGPRRAILVSFDALNEARVRESLPRDAVPNFLALFEGGACVAHAVSAFPSVTAPSHAVLWTGAYGDVT
ncbi:MAG TPA: alkaline phosphatase family protein, partial [Longimicrobiales bacterium]